MPLSSLGFDLDRGERELWAGAPRTGIVFRSGDLMMVPFSLLWGGFAFFWEFSVYQSRAPWHFRLFGLPFVLIGLYLIVGRFFVDAYRRARTAYLVTSDRVIIESGVFVRTTKSLNLRTLTDVTLTDSGNGIGTITFGPQLPGAAQFQGMAWPGTQTTPAFDLIPDADRVYAIIRRAQEQASTSGAAPA